HTEATQREELMQTLFSLCRLCVLCAAVNGLAFILIPKIRVHSAETYRMAYTAFVIKYLPGKFTVDLKTSG
ncbi:MAG: hypothetical protein L0220_22985, partial [Acidobacteria bacterium]|nr:hypothetical protein [Acidobacteriota bacterium]